MIIWGDEMTKKEFITFALALKTYYPRDQIMPNDPATELWFNQLKDLPYKVAETALNTWVATNKWAPTIADIREKAYEIMQNDALEWGSGWEQVIKCIGKYGYMRRDEALHEMDEITQECVKRLGWYELCMSENQTADRANFRKIYESIAERKKQMSLIPISVQQEIEKLIANGQGLIGING